MDEERQALPASPRMGSGNILIMNPLCDIHDPSSTPPRPLTIRPLTQSNSSREEPRLIAQTAITKDFTRHLGQL